MMLKITQKKKKMAVYSISLSTSYHYYLPYEASSVYLKKSLKLLIFDNTITIVPSVMVNSNNENNITQEEDAEILKIIYY